MISILLIGIIVLIKKQISNFQNPRSSILNPASKIITLPAPLQVTAVDEDQNKTHPNKQAPHAFPVR